MKKKLTIKDIASLSGVSVSTVSRVLNNDYGVSQKTKDKIEKIILENNYRPSMLARGMISKKTKMIALVVSDITNPYFYQFVASIDAQLIEKGYTLSLIDTQTANKIVPEKSILTEITIFQKIQENNFDAVLILGGLIDQTTLFPEYREALHNLAKETPVIILGREMSKLLNDSKNIFSIRRNQTIPTQLITNHLLQKGYRQLAFIGGSSDTWIAQKRTETFRATLATHQLSVNEKLIINNDFYAQNGYEATTQLINSGIEYDAIIAINDRVAQGALRALKDFSLSKAVASCEYFPDNDFNIPRITSVNHHHHELAQKTVNLLTDVLEEQEIKAERFSPPTPQLIIGESC